MYMDLFHFFIAAFGLLWMLMPVATLVLVWRIDRKLGHLAGALERAPGPKAD